MAGHISQAHVPLGLYGVSPQQQIRGAVDPAGNIIRGHVYDVPANGPHTPSFRGFGSAASMLRSSGAQLVKAAGGVSLTTWSPGEAGWARTAPSNEIGAEIRLAYFYATAARLCDGAGKSGPAKRFYNEAKKSNGRAVSWVSTRLSPSGQWLDSGKVEHPQRISARFDTARILLKKWSPQVPRLNAVLDAMKGITPQSITLAQTKMGESPGSPSSKTNTALIVGGTLLALAYLVTTQR